MIRPLVVFICTANRCRSVMAEYYLRHLLEKEGYGGKVDIVSAGIMAEEYWEFYQQKMSSFGHNINFDEFYGIAPYPSTLYCMNKQGWDIEQHLSQELTPYLVETAELVIAMENEQKEASLKQYPELDGRILTLRELSGEDKHLLLEESYYEPEYDPSDPHFVKYSKEYVEDSFDEIKNCLDAGLLAILKKLQVN